MRYRPGISDGGLVDKDPAAVVNKDDDAICRIFHLDISIRLSCDIQTQTLG